MAFKDSNITHIRYLNNNLYLHTIHKGFYHCID